MALPKPPARIGRRMFLATAYVGAAFVAAGWFDDLHPVLHATVPLRAAALAGVGVAVQRRWVPQTRGQQALFWIGALLATLRAALPGDVPVERAAATVMASISLLLPLALLVAPSHRRLVWASGTGLLGVAAASVAVLPRNPVGFGLLVVYLTTFCVLLLALDRSGGTADVAWGMAHTDELTGLANRRAVQVELDRFLSAPLADRGAEPEGSGGARFRTCLLMVDLDDFKGLNDREGHAAGDDALRTVAAVLRSAVGAETLVGRWGGEEFVVLSRCATIDAAFALGERLREALERDTPVTVSIGLAAARPDDDAFSWMHRADSALYRAKRAGRNVVMAEAMLPETNPATSASAVAAGSVEASGTHLHARPGFLG